MVGLECRGESLKHPGPSDLPLPQTSLQELDRVVPLLEVTEHQGRMGNHGAGERRMRQGRIPDHLWIGLDVDCDCGVLATCRRLLGHLATAGVFALTRLRIVAGKAALVLIARAHGAGATAAATTTAANLPHARTNAGVDQRRRLNDHAEHRVVITEFITGEPLAILLLDLNRLLLLLLLHVAAAAEAAAAEAAAAEAAASAADAAATTE